MLDAVLVRKKKQEYQDEEARFEREFFLAQPAMYQEYMKKKEENREAGNEGVTWLTPSSVEEAEQLLEVFGDIEAQLKPSKQELEQTQQLAQFLGQADLFNGINIDEMREDV